jgi:hypothetical protein
MASHILPRLLADPSLEGLKDVDLFPRLLSYAAIAAGAAISATALGGDRASSGTGDVLISVGNVGDHMRMLNVATRLHPPRPLRVIANDTAASLTGVYIGVELDPSGGRYGADFIQRSMLRLAKRTTRSFARALVCQPMLTQPQAIAEALTVADDCIVLGSGIVRGVDRVPFAETSWRDGYERFFEACYPGATFLARPRIAHHLIWNGHRSNLIAIHTGGDSHVRGIASESFTELACRISSDGFVPVIVGAANEEAQLRRSFSGIECAFAIELPMQELAALLARCAALCAIDSSVMNLADAVGLPCVIAYNLTDPSANGPYYAPLAAVIARGARSLGATAHGRWKAAAPNRGISPTASELHAALTGLLSSMVPTSVGD